MKFNAHGDVVFRLAGGPLDGSVVPSTNFASDRPVVAEAAARAETFRDTVAGSLVWDPERKVYADA